MKKIINIFTPSWKKIFITFLLSILALWSIIWSMGYFMGCNWGWACNGLTLIPVISWVSLAILIMPVYFLSGVFELFFYEWFDYLYEIHVWWFIFGFFVIVWIYILVSIIMHVASILKKW